MHPKRKLDYHDIFNERNDRYKHLVDVEKPGNER